MSKKKYVCECGFETDNFTIFGGHCKGCKKHIRNTDILEIRHCKFCNSEFTCKKSSTKQYCSTTCANKNKTGKIKYKKYKTKINNNWVCEVCNQSFKTRRLLLEHKNITGHKRNYAPGKNTISETKCKFCERTFTNSSALTLHEKYCKNNPNKEMRKGHPHSEETKQKLSETRKNKIASGEIKLSDKTYKGISGIYKGIHCDSTWELAFLIFCIDHKIPIKRCNYTYKYELNGETHTYFPDFDINGNIVEIKNYHTEEVDAKVKSVTDRKIVVLYGKNLKNVFNYVENIYKTKEYWTLYDYIDNGKREQDLKYRLIKRLLFLLNKILKTKSKIIKKDKSSKNIVREKKIDIEKYNKYKETDQIDKLGRATDKKNSKEEWQRRLNIILDTKIDLTKYGWMSKLQKLNISLSGQQIIRTLNYFNIDYYKLPNARISDKGNEEYLKSGPHYCEKCGKLIEKKFGSGRFCSKACANGRNHTEEQKQKIRDSIKKYNDNKNN